MRRENDFYPTPEWATNALINNVPEIRREVVFEPCAGDGAMVKPLIKAGCSVITNDIDESRETDYHFDASIIEQWPLDVAPWVVTNPPFNTPSHFIYRRR